MRGIIFGTTYERSKRKFEEIIENYRFIDINPIKIIRTKQENQVMFENGDLWKTASTPSSRCGTRCNIAYIDRQLDEEYVKCCIRPCLTVYPYQAEHYFDFWEEEETQ